MHSPQTRWIYEDRMIVDVTDGAYTVIAENVCEGDAAQLVAAPDLLAALEQFLSAGTTRAASPYTDIGQARAKARAAIAKAKGEG